METDAPVVPIKATEPEPATHEDDPILSGAEVARQLGLAPSTITRQCTEGWLEAAKIGPNRWGIRQSLVNRLLRAASGKLAGRTVHAPGPPPADDGELLTIEEAADVLGRSAEIIFGLVTRELIGTMVKVDDRGVAQRRISRREVRRIHQMIDRLAPL